MMLAETVPAMGGHMQPEPAPEIVYPAIYNLRVLQMNRGIDVSRLNQHQRGLEPLQHLHHISKTVGNDASSYRVRVCKSCSGLPKLLELGSYADLESAVLVNDGYELLQARTQKLHLLVPHDVDFLQLLTVRRHARGKIEEANLFDILQEKIIRTRTKRNIVEVTPQGAVTQQTVVDDMTASYVVKRNRYDENEQYDDGRGNQGMIGGGQMIPQATGMVSGNSSAATALAQLNGGYLNPPMKLQTMLSTMRTHGKTLTAMYLWFGIQPNEKSVENNLNALSRLLRTQYVSPMGYEYDDTPARRDLVALSRTISLPASNIYNLIACYSPGDTADIQSIVSRLQGTLAAPSLSAQSESKVFNQTMKSLKRASQNPQLLPAWKQMINEVVQYSRITLHGYIWVDYAMKLPIWTESFDAAQDMFGIETKCQGMMGACNARVERSLRLLTELSNLTRNAINCNSAGALQLFSELRRANLLLSRATVFGLLQLATVSFLVAKVCDDFSAVENCIRQFEKVWPQVDTTSCPLLLLMMLTHRYLEIVTFGLARLDMSGWHSKIEERISLAMKLQRDLIRLGRASGILDKRANEIPYGPGFMQFHEKAIRCYATLLALTAALGDSSFFATEGYSLRTTVDMAHHIMMALHEWITTSQCCLYDAHTYLSLQTLAQACQKLIQLYSEFARPLQYTYSLCIEVLNISSQRFGLPKVLLESLSNQPDYQAAPALSQTVAQISAMQASWSTSSDKLLTFNLRDNLNPEAGNVDELSGFRNPAMDPPGFHTLNTRFEMENEFAMNSNPTGMPYMTTFGRMVSGTPAPDSLSTSMGSDTSQQLKASPTQYATHSGMPQSMGVAQDFGHGYAQMPARGQPPQMAQFPTMGNDGMDPSLFRHTPDPLFSDILTESPGSATNFNTMLFSVGRTMDSREINLDVTTTAFQREDSAGSRLNGMTPEQIALLGEPNATRVV